MTILVGIDTDLGPFSVALETEKAPVTAANFLRYVDGGHIAGMTAYRIVTLDNQPRETVHKIEVVQWGVPPVDNAYAHVFPTIAHEPTSVTGLQHKHLTLSMARFAPGTAGAGFFICIGDQPALDHGGGRNPDGLGFAAFGQVVSGEDVVRSIFGRAQRDSESLATPVQFTGARRL
ncbi:MAG TPA: peptidylprolyl isomerase [Devosia sp.]|jgi:peptidyl-prolyl cis-trans isomerase A (cyclophilin A)|uniref:peptidylprolyl isomerase n=1 Tax=Devosia sp. TaxID=1871048 RepID=UPI002F95B0C1